MRSRFGWLLLLTAGACHAPTPNGTTLFEERLDGAQGQVKSHMIPVVLGADKPSKLEFSVETVEAEGAKRIVKISAVVVDNGGWAVSYLGKGNPLNLGTIEAPLMALPVMLQQYKEGIGGKHTAQHSVTVRGDGTVEMTGKD